MKKKNYEKESTISNIARVNGFGHMLSIVSSFHSFVR